MRLADGSQTSDRRLDRLIEFDPRSKNFPISAVVPDGVTSRRWALDERLDQGSQGACVGFGVSHRLAAAPVERSNITNASALSIYNAAKKIDPWPGEDYEGTSVLAGIKVAKNRGYFSEYRWCFSVDDVMRAVCFEGPVVVGTNWRSTMWDTRPSGLIDSVGTPNDNEGGHCYMIRGLTLHPRLTGESASLEPVFRITNSWGKGWGWNGEAFIRISDFEKLLLDDGEAVVPRETHTAPTSLSFGAKLSAWFRSWIDRLLGNFNRGRPGAPRAR